jgi:uncharacterized protein (TIGR02246 family)
MTRDELAAAMEGWLEAWGRYDLLEVTGLFAEDGVFETWTGLRIEGRENIRKAWKEWFEAGGFRFVPETVLIDEESQSAAFSWLYEGPAKCFGGRNEKRRGIDLIVFRDGLIAEKITYSKTSLEVEGRRVNLTPGERR